MFWKIISDPPPYALLELCPVHSFGTLEYRPTLFATRCKTLMKSILSSSDFPSIMIFDVGCRDVNFERYKSIIFRPFLIFSSFSSSSGSFPSSVSTALISSSEKNKNSHFKKYIPFIYRVPLCPKSPKRVSF